MSQRLLLILAIMAGLVGFAWFVLSLDHRTERVGSAPTPTPSRAAPDSVPAPHAATAKNTATAERSKATVSGTAIFQDTRAPAAGVLVSVYCEKSDEQHEATTNENGEFTLSDIDADTDLLWRAKVGGDWRFVIADQPRLLPGENRTGVEILLQSPPRPVPKAEVSGTIWDASKVNRRMLELFPKLIEAEGNQDRPYYDGWQKEVHQVRTPLPGIQITLEGNNSKRETTSGTQGRYAFTDVPAGQYIIRATPPHGAVVERASNHYTDRDLGPGERRIELRPGAIENSVDFQFRFDTAAFAGHVRDTAGNPIPDAEISATMMEEQSEIGPINKPLSVETSSAPDGSYRLDGLITLSGAIQGTPTYEISAQADGYVSQHLQLSACDEQVLLGLIDVFDQHNGFDDAEVVAMRDQLASMLPRTKGNTFSGVDFALPRSTTIAGELVDPQSNPLVGSLLYLTSRPIESPPRDIPACPQPAAVTTSSRGEFCFVDVPPGEYDIRAEIGGAVVRTKHSPLVIMGGEEIRGLRVVAEVQTPGSIEGHVTTADGRRLNSDYNVRVESIENPLETRPRTGRFMRDPADPQKFYFDDISPGNIKLSIDAPGYATVKAQTKLSPGATAKLEITLAPECVLRVFVTRNGDPVEDGSSVSAVQVTDGTARGRQIDASYQTDEDIGYHKVTQLPQGQYDITATYLDGAVYRKQRTRISVRASAVTEITIDLVGGTAGIHGTLFGEDKPGEGEVIILDAAESANESYPFDRSTRAQYWMSKPPRAFAIDGLPAGTYRVIGRLGPRGDRSSWEERELTVTLRDGETRDLTFDD